MRAAEADCQAARGGPNLDVSQVVVRVIQQQKDLVVAIEVAGGKALGRDAHAQVAGKDKGLVLSFLQLANLPLQRIGVGGVDAFAQYGAPKLGRPGLADGVELGVQSVSQQDKPVIDLARDALQLAALAFDELLLLGQLALHEIHVARGDKLANLRQWQIKNAQVADGVEVYQKVGEAYEVATAAANEAFGANNAVIYKNGMTYYWTSVKHLGAAGKTGQFGMVRNHFYQVDVTKITGFGTAVYNPDNEFVPVTPDEDPMTYLAARINVLSWRVVANGVELGK